MTLELRRHNKTKWRVQKTAVYSDRSHEDMLEWCKENFGEPGRIRGTAAWRYTRTSLNHSFTFKRETDAMLFLIRWG